MDEQYKHTRGPYSGPMPPESEPTPKEEALIKQNEAVRSELAMKKVGGTPEKEPKDKTQEEIKEIIIEDVTRFGSKSGKKPTLDYYDNKRDVGSGPGDKNPPYSGKFGTTYHDDRDY